MEVCFDLPNKLLQIIITEYIIKPVCYAAITILLGYIASFVINHFKKRQIKSSARLLYEDYHLKINKLQDSFHLTNRWYKGREEREGNLSIPEIDSGGILLRQISNMLKWLPDDEFSYNLYYLEKHLKSYSKLKEANINLDSDKELCDLFRKSLVTASNVYMKLLYFANEPFYKRYKVVDKCNNNPTYPLEYFGIDVLVKDEFWFVMEKHK